MSAAEGKEIIREKRYLVYPKPASKVQFIVGTGIPIPLERHAVTMGWVVKAKYSLATNASEYTDSYVTFQKRSLQRQSASRYDFYRIFEAATERFTGSGKECMLRSICEASAIPLTASSLLAQILRIFLLPSSTDETPLLRSDMDYHNAERLGRARNADCKILYPSCSLALIDLLTVVK
ncbi:hypothetical protein RUM44_005811 [Polyplax serrata]